MSTLLELANAGRELTFGEKKITVYGVSAEDLVGIITKYPLIMKAFSGVDVETPDIMKVAPQAIADIIAVGTGNKPTDENLKAARRLPVEMQLDIVSAIIKQTFPTGGVGPFVQKLEGLGLLVAGPEAAQLLRSSEEQRTNSSNSGTTDKPS